MPTHPFCCISDVTAQLYQRDPSGLRRDPFPLGNAHLEPTRSVHHVEGGPRYAIFELCNYAAPLEPLLRAPIAITHQNGDLCWSGYVAYYYKCCGEIGWGATLDTMFNRVAVRYIIGSETRITPWAEDLQSIQRYGVKELIVARGWWDTLNWQYDIQPCGYSDSGYTGTGNPRPFGLGFTSTHVGFRQSNNAQSISTDNTQLAAFPVGEEIVVTGSAHNDIITAITRRLSTTLRTVANTTISFDPLDDVMDSLSLLNRFVVGEMITIQGSQWNDGVYWVKRVITDGSRIEVSPNTIVLEPAGNTITLHSGSAIQVDTILTDEAPGATVTILARTQYICQPICHTRPNPEPALAGCNEPWTLNHIQLPLRIVGQPTDDVEIAIGPTCTNMVATGTIPATELSASFTTVGLSFSTGVTITPRRMCLRPHRAQRPTRCYELL